MATDFNALAEAVEVAILRICNGAQEITCNGEVYKEADLGKLQNMHSHFLQLSNKQSSAGAFQVNLNHSGNP